MNVMPSYPAKIAVLLAIWALLGTGKLCAQTEMQDDWQNSRRRVNNNGMIVLGSWATANILAGGIAATQTEGSIKQFWIMNAGWNAINLGLAGSALLRDRKPTENTLSSARNLQEQLKLERIFLFNTGLDLAYVAAGFWMQSAAKTRTGIWNERLDGWGKSIVLQGGFLAVFDGIMYFTHRKNGRKQMEPLWSLRPDFTPRGAVLSVSIAIPHSKRFE